MKYIKIHKSKFIKFFIFVLACVFGFFGVNIMVHADSIWPFGDVSDDGNYPSNYMMNSYFNWDSFYLQFELADIEAVAGGNDTLVWFGDGYSTTATDYWKFSNFYSSGGVANTFDLPRTIVLNKLKSNDNLLYYDCSIELAGNEIIFEKNDFFMRLNDLQSERLSSVKFPQTNVYVSMEIQGFILDKDGNTRDLSLVRADKYVTHNSQFYLYPTKNELFGNINFNEVYSSNAIMYISNYRCLIEFPSTSELVSIPCNYYYSVQSVEDYNTRYGTILTDYVNIVSSSDIVGGVADNVNSFLQIEILPGLSFFGILLLAIAVPMLIWILKIFFGG